MKKLILLALLFMGCGYLSIPMPGEKESMSAGKTVLIVAGAVSLVIVSVALIWSFKIKANTKGQLVY